MSISTLNSEITRLTNDIVTLQNKLAREKKNESDKRVKIANIKKTITKNTSASTLSSKMKQCEQLEKEITESVKKQAKLQKDIADKEKRLNNKSASLHKEQQKEQKNQQAKQQKIIKSYETKISSLQNTVEDQNDDIKYDVFISYASEDAGFVDSLVEELHKLDVKVWQDKLSIGWGNSIRKSIDSGLLKSRFAIAVISKIYLEKYWTNYEVDGILNLETTTRKVFLPIWHNVTVDDVKAFSPSLAGRKALETKSITAYGIAEILKKTLDENK